MKKIILFFLILFSLSLVNAVVVEDISQQIEQGNETIMQSNAELIGKVNSLSNQVLELQKQLIELKEQQINKTDLPQLYSTIEAINNGFHGQILATSLTLILFVLALLALAKSRGWL